MTKKSPPLILDVERPCPKCKGDDTWVRYQADSHTHGCKDHGAFGHRPGDACCTDEHFDRGCRRCSYTWREKVLS